MTRRVHFAYQGDTWELDRTVFRYGHTDHHLPRIIIIAAIHGNEPTGLRALLELKPFLRQHSANLNGEVIGLIGNFRALEQNRRFIDKDLNRMWADHIRPDGRSEDYEKHELNSLLEEHLAGEGPRLVLDLHTTSSDSDPFMTVADTEQNRRFAANFSIPGIAGIERFIEGPIASSYLTDGPCRPCIRSWSTYGPSIGDQACELCQRGSTSQRSVPF